MFDHYLSEARVTSDMEKLAKAHPRIDNVSRMKVPKLDEEVYQVVDQSVRTADQLFQAIQKAVLASWAAFALVIELAVKRAKLPKDSQDRDP